MHSVGAEHHEVLCLCPLLDLCVFSVSQSVHSLESHDVKYIPKDIDKTVFSTRIKAFLLSFFTPSKILDWETAVRKHPGTLQGGFF